MARLFFDHNVPFRLVSLLRVTGHDILLAREAGAARSTDDAVLLSSVRANRVLVTHNRRDFRLLHDAWLSWPPTFGVAFPAHRGILVLDVAPPETLADVLATYLGGVSARRLANAIFWWHLVAPSWWLASADTWGKLGAVSSGRSG